MIRTRGFILVIFTFGFNFQSIRGVSAQASINTSSVILAPSDNILDFLEAVKSSALAIESQIDAQASENLIRMNRRRKFTGVSSREFIFISSVVKESTAKVLTLANDIRQKIEVIETEKNLRLFAIRLIGGGNRTSLDNWLENKATELTEAVVRLTSHYSELSQSYQSYLINFGVLKRRLAIAETYDLSGSSDDGDDPSSKICRNGMFRCENGIRNITCVRYCNGHSECGDESDEPSGCVNLFGSNCPSGQFRCDDGECIESQRRCGRRNGYGQNMCKDGSDSHYC